MRNHTEEGITIRKTRSSNVYQEMGHFKTPYQFVEGTFRFCHTFLNQEPTLTKEILLDDKIGASVQSII